MSHSKIISGIDIGTSKVTTIIGQYSDTEDKFNVIAVSSIPSLGFRKGQIINIEQASSTIVQSIESAERMAGFQINSASISLSAPYIESINSHGVVAISNPNGEIDQNDITRVIEAAKAIAIYPLEVIDPNIKTTAAVAPIAIPINFNESITLS
jgi:cell division protein FtsA